MINSTLQSENEANIPLASDEPIEQVNRYDYTPRPFKDIPLLWLKIFKMDAAFFENEIRHTSVINTLLGVLLYSCIYSILSYFLTYLNSVLAPVDGYPFPLATWKFEFTLNSILFNALIRNPLGFYFGSYLLFLVAKLFRGAGTYNEQIYLTVIYAPMVSFIQQIGRFFQYTFSVFYMAILFIPLLILLIYSLVLSIRSFRIVHKFSTGKALAIIFGSTVILMFLFFN